MGGACGMLSITIKSCPFCGKAAETSFTTIDLENRGHYGWIGCRKCGVMLRYYNLPGYFERAAAVWNRRAAEEKET